MAKKEAQQTTPLHPLAMTQVTKCSEVPHTVVVSFGGSVILALALSVVALCFGGKRASAQVQAQTYRGMFRLEQEVRWGQAVLPPGEYSIVLHSPERGSIATIRGEHKTVMVMANGAEPDASAKPSSFLLIGDSKTPSVRRLHLAEFGMDLYYPVGKPELEVKARNQQDTFSVPLASVGK